jgi:hypothetical protein
MFASYVNTSASDRARHARLNVLRDLRIPKESIRTSDRHRLDVDETLRLGSPSLAASDNARVASDAPVGGIGN